MNSFFQGVMNDYQEPQTESVDMPTELYQHISDDYPEVGLGENMDRGIPEDSEPFPMANPPKDYGPQPTNPNPVQATSKGEFGVEVAEPAKTSEDFHKALMAQENGIESGKNPDTGMWKPHSSLEGGEDTLGYGHKLTPRESKGGYVTVGGEKINIAEGVSQEQIEALYHQDVSLAEKRLERDIEGFRDFPEKYRNILTNISFNTGKVSSRSWPKLLKAMERGDDEGVRREMVTSYKGQDGKRISLTERAAAIADATLG